MAPDDQVVPVSLDAWRRRSSSASDSCAGSKSSPQLLQLGIVGALAIAGGLIAGLVAWIGALLNTWQLENKTWFAGLLLLGIFNFGFFAMVAFLVAGPDGSSDVAVRSPDITSRPTTA